MCCFCALAFWFAELLQAAPVLQLLKWLLARLRPREVDSNKQYASEILAILVQQSGMLFVCPGRLNRRQSSSGASCPGRCKQAQDGGHKWHRCCSAGHRALSEQVKGYLFVSGFGQPARLCQHARQCCNTQARTHARTHTLW